MLNTGAVAAKWRLSTRSVVNLALLLLLLLLMSMMLSNCVVVDSRRNITWRQTARSRASDVLKATQGNVVNALLTDVKATQPYLEAHVPS